MEKQLLIIKFKTYSANNMNLKTMDAKKWYISTENGIEIMKIILK